MFQYAILRMDNILYFYIPKLANRLLLFANISKYEIFIIPFLVLKPEYFCKIVSVP